MLSAGIGAYLYYEEFMKTQLFRKEDFPMFLQNFFSGTHKKYENTEENSDKSEKSTDLVLIPNPKKSAVSISDHIPDYIPLFSISLERIYANKGKSLLFLLGFVTYSNRKKLNRIFSSVKKYFVKDKKPDITAKQIKEEIQNYGVNDKPDDKPDEKSDNKPGDKPDSPLSNASDSDLSIISNAEVINHTTESETNGEEFKCPFSSWFSDINLPVFKK